MKRFEVGDVVRVIDGPRKGEVTTVTSGLVQVLYEQSWKRYGLPLVHRLALESRSHPGFSAGAPPAWLEHLRDSREKGEWDELTRKLCERGRVGA